MSFAICLNLDQSKILSPGNWLTTDNTLPHIAVENIERKGEIPCNKQFLLFSLCFLPYMALIFHFKCTLKCRLQFV